MEEDLELKLPLLGAEERSAAWPVEQEPTDLIVFWPGDAHEAPTQTEVLAALRSRLGDALQILEEGVEDDAEPADPKVHWAVVVRMKPLREPVIIWAQQASDLPAGSLGDDAAEACRWVVGFEAMLDARDPLSSYNALVKAIAQAIPEAPAILDVNSTAVHRRDQLNEAFSDDEDDVAIEPSAENLWMVHVVHAPDEQSGDERGGTVWLHTHGLWRCGLPELEMLEIPAKHAAAAAELLNDIAALMFEYPPTPPGQLYQVGDGLAVTLQPWSEVTATMDASTPGGPADRVGAPGENPHAGVRAVICGAEQRGSFRQVWTWPREVIERLERDDATIYMTHRATTRQARIARARWGDLATAFASAQKAALLDAQDPRAVFLVKAGYPVNGSIGNDGDTACEHLWFEVHHFSSDGAEATLINQPVNVPALKRGDRMCVERSSVSDWQVHTAAGSFGPQDVNDLWRAIDELKGASPPRS